MTQVYDEQACDSVTVLQAGPCFVAQVKDSARDGYSSIQVGFGETKEHRVSRPLKGHYQKLNLRPCRYLREFRVKDPAAFTTGQELRADLFAPGDVVDVSAITRGKGFSCSIKRLGFARGAKTHGSHYHRGPGSLGSITAARVFKGRPLPGRMGGKRRTIQNLRVVQTDGEKNILLVKGSVPGPQGGLVEIKEAVKSKG